MSAQTPEAAVLTAQHAPHFWLFTRPGFTFLCYLSKRSGFPTGFLLKDPVGFFPI
jgi:hypothetical protein